MKFREPLELNCPRCDHRFERSLAWIREDGQRCPECRVSLASIREGIEGTITDWTRFVEDAERIIAMEDEFKAKIEDLGDWRGETLRRVRALIRQADPEVVEELKWKKPSNPTGVPVWSHDGILCTGETYKAHVKLTFAKGAPLEDPSRLFNSSLEGNVRRAIDIREGDEIDEEAFKTLVRAAAVLNTS